MSNSNSGIWILFGLLGLGALLLLSKRDNPVQQQGDYADRSDPYFPEENRLHFIPTNRAQAPAYQPPVQASNAYDNEEVREITYNDDGLPTRIVIHRHAKVQ
jgi:hypothetical protein